MALDHPALTGSDWLWMVNACLWCSPVAQCILRLGMRHQRVLAGYTCRLASPLRRQPARWLDLASRCIYLHAKGDIDFESRKSLASA